MTRQQCSIKWNSLNLYLINARGKLKTDQRHKDTEITQKFCG